jgi:SEC-C motif
MRPATNYGASVRRTIQLEDAGDRTVVRDMATVTFEGEGFPLDRMTEIVEALDAAGPAMRPRRAAKVGRNAACPCGSGRKYKKCCGSASSCGSRARRRRRTPRRSPELCESYDRSVSTEAREVAGGGFLMDAGPGT